MEIVLEHVVAFGGALFLGWYLIPLMIRAAQKLRLLDVPDGKIKQHKVPVPYLGGLGVYVTFIIVLALAYPFGGRLVWFLVGTTLLLFVGLTDDFNVLTPFQKLAGQIVAVACFLKGGIALKSRFFDDYFNLAASAFWMLSIINAFNLVDVMDGLATSLAIVSATAFFLMAVFLGKYMISLLIVILLGALFAFLFYNKPPAKIYLGDAGALFVGGFLAAMPLLFQWTKILNTHRSLPSFAQGSVIFETAISALPPVLVVGLPLLEVGTLILIRKYKGIPFYSGSPHHFALYLRRKGWSVVQVLFFSVAAASFLSALGLLFMFGKIPFAGVVVGLSCFLPVWFWVVFS